jgi:hypothetical protein
MAIQWTGPMIKKCAHIYSKEGMKVCMKATGLTSSSIRHKMLEVGAVNPIKRGSTVIPRKRNMYAEDVALIFELKESGLNSKVIAEYFDTTSVNIRTIIKRAVKSGFDAYPLRNK